MAEYKRVASIDGSTGHTGQKMSSKKGTHKSSKKSHERLNNNGTQDSSNKKSTIFFRLSEPKPKAQSQPRPTIIRCGSSYTKKRPPPPRPPPPKINSMPDINGALKPKPPSYEEVVEADLNAFIGEMKAPRVAPRIPIRPRPPVPSNAHAPKLRLQSVSQNKPPQQAATDMLIDFNDSPVIMPSNTKDVSTPNKQSLLDLDDIFSCNGYDTSYVTPLQTNGARSSKTNDFSDLTSNKQGLGPRVLPPGPVPAPQRHGTSLLNSSNTNDNTLSSRGEVWLQSCLMGTTNVDFGYSQSALSEKSQNVDTFMNGHSIPQTPHLPLPPRPHSASRAAPINVSLDANYFTPDISQKPGSELSIAMFPPPVPPLPQGGFTSSLDQVADHEPPPLPPRPKWFEERPYAVALFDYNASQSDELSFKANDMITLVYSVNKDWFYGTHNDEEGIFPKSFANVIVPLPPQEEDEVVGNTSEPCCEALYDFVGENEEELSFAAGDIILLESKGTDWFRGRRNGTSGLFPASYVKIITDLQPSESSNATSEHTAQDESNVYIALYDFNGESGELSFQEGDRIVVSGDVNGEWILGRLEGGQCEGRLPKTFVQKLSVF